MLDRMEDRCRRICGDGGSDCFVNSKDQLSCIADMIVNKTASIAMGLSFALESGDKEILEDCVRDTITNTHELQNWIKYLQLVKDLRHTGDLVMNSLHSVKREEIRYPVPQEYEGQIEIRVRDPEMNLKLIDFSQSGFKVVSDRPLEATRIFEAVLFNTKNMQEGQRMTADTMFCRATDGGYQIGARVLSLEGAKVFNFFNGVYSVIMNSAG
jgi:hypothetical protein